MFVAFLCLRVLWFCAVVSAPWASELAAFLAVTLHAGWQCGFKFSDPQKLVADPVPGVQIPLKHRLSLQAFNTQLFCLLVLQFSPSPSPLQVLFICPVSSPLLNADSSPSLLILCVLGL